MRRAVEAVGFVAVAAAAHLALAGIVVPEGGIEGRGEGGETLLSLTAADAALAVRVAEWERPPAPPVEAPLPMVAPSPRASPAPALPPTPPPRSAAGSAIPAPAAPTMAAPATAAPPPPPPAPTLAEVPDRMAPPPPRPDRQATAAPRPDRPPSQAAPPQRARGQGGAAAAGDTGRPATEATLSDSARQSLAASWGARVRAQIERRKRYPRAAGGAAGTATLRIVVGRDGALHAAGLARSSGHPALDAAALDAVRDAGRFPRAPDDLREPSYSFTLPMTFSG